MAATEEDNISPRPAPSEKAAWDAVTEKFKKELADLQKQGQEGDRRGEVAAHGRDRGRLKIHAPDPLPTIPATRNDFDKRTPIHVLKRGVWETKGEAVGPRPPSILVSDDLPELPADVRDPRTQLARWLVDPKHPLTPRVMVNRLWQHHFGAGLVKTVNDFGTKGDRPSHPELLDWLAAHAGRRRLEAQAAPPADRPEQHLPPVGPIADRERGERERSRKPPPLARPTPTADGRGGPRRDARRLRPAQPQGRRPERDGPGRPGPDEAPLQAHAVAGPTRARTSTTGGRSTCSPSETSDCPSSRPSTPRPCCRAAPAASRAPTHPRPSNCSTASSRTTSPPPSLAAC